MKFDFIGKKAIWFTISFVIIVIGILSIAFKGINLGIEFKGGTVFDIKFNQEVKVGEIRDLLKEFKLEKSIIQSLEDDELLIRTKALTKESQSSIVEKMEKEFGIKEVIYIQNVSAAWGEQITRAALLALILALTLILIFISLRFEFKMAVNAILAIFHDILITVGIYALVGREVTPATVGALLSILGYSLYDTIVVFHRIAENSKKIGKRTYSMMVNDSINQVFMRSVNTSLTSLLPVISLLLIGGETLKDFAFALFIGLISGAYSSVFFASPILAIWKETEPRYSSLKRKYAKINS
ncbi:MAG: protein translocase subunit SecF [Actinomycetia bacterium]|nr:protein translocase subunit SecF [Actinomycetes bacterium]